MPRNPKTIQAARPQEAQLATLGAAALKALGSVMDAIPGRPSRPQELARALGINKVFCSRLVGALRSSEPLAGVHALPGTAPLRSFLAAAEQTGVAPKITAHAGESVERLDVFIRKEFGARSNLRGLLSAHVPDAHEELLSTSKQAAFRGMAGIHGLELEAVLVTFLVHPSPHKPGWCDTAVINASYGLRRSRPNASYSFTLRRLGRDQDERLAEVLLPEFCAPEGVELAAKHEGECVRQTLLGSDFGRRHTTDIVTTELYEANQPIDPAAEHEPPTRWFYATVSHPSRRLLFDVLVHKDVWATAAPELLIYDTIMHGEVIPDDPRFAHSKLDLLEEVQPIASASRLPRCPEVPRYGELLDHVCDRHGWSRADFRGHRVRSTYPLFGSQYCLTFTPR